MAVNKDRKFLNEFENKERHHKTNLYAKQQSTVLNHSDQGSILTADNDATTPSSGQTWLLHQRVD